MTWKQKAMAAADAIGATIRVDSSPYTTIALEAPPGHHWCGTGLHEHILANAPPTVPMETVWRAAVEDIAAGIEPCGPDCEWWD